MSLLNRPADAVAHLDPDTWAHVNRALVRKAIAEFSHERLLAPVRERAAAPAGSQCWSLEAGNGVVYHFRARVMALLHWRVDPASIVRTVDGVEQPLDALCFVIDFREQLGIRPDQLPVYLEEISSTLCSAAFKHRNNEWSSEALGDAEFQTYEHAMTEGHPAFVANNGRLGFDADDYRVYAPESGATFRIIWLAVRRDCATFASLSTLSYDALIEHELGAAQRQRFAAELRRLGLTETDYLYMPAHPWQWLNKLSIAFAAHVANRDIVCLGPSEDDYRPQQSIRTYFNDTRPERHYVKTSLGILNMGFMRGLSPAYMAGTPAINEWVHGIVEADPFLRDNGFSILREVAWIGFRHRHFEAAVANDSPYKKMLSCLWRESPVPRLTDGERLMTMSALLHVDREGHALLPVLVTRSGLPAPEWLGRFLTAYLEPLVHCFYAHDLVFMPHGENVILVMRRHTPVRAIMKDIAEECAVLDENALLPEKVRRLAVPLPDDLKPLAIFMDVFDGFLRFVAQEVVEARLCDEDTFWRCVAHCIAGYQEAHPQYRAKFRRHDLFAPDFPHSCLNRLQLSDNRQMLNLADPAASLKLAGRLANPIAKYRPSPSPVA